MKTSSLALIFLGAVAGAWWGVQRNEAAQLRGERQRQLEEGAELERLRQAHARLLRLQPSTAELDQLRRDADRQALRARDQSRTAATPPAPPAFRPGVWASVADWKNRGRATPESALETMLWASAGGDIAALKDTLEFDEASRAKIAALLARSSDSARRTYATPEDLLALVLAANIPLERAQLVARQPLGKNSATAFVRIKSADGATRQVYLSLHADASGWKLRVPAAVVNRLAQELPKTLEP